MAEGNARGRFVWYDLLTTDPPAAQDFYGKVTGWTTLVWDGPEPYTMWKAGEKPIGGVMQLPPGLGVPSHWYAYIETPDVDATTAQAESLGGRVIEKPTDIPTVGRFAILADPHGAVFAAFKPEGGAPGEDTDAAVGEFSWHELMTTDYEAAFDFYRALFGWEKIAAHDMGPLGVYFIFGRGATQVGGMFNTPVGMQAPPHWMQYVRVDNVDAAAARVTANGGTILHGPEDVPGGDRILQCLDPQGAAFALHQKHG